MHPLEIMLDARLKRLEHIQAEGLRLLARQCGMLEDIEGHLYVASVALLHTALGTGELPETIDAALKIRTSNQEERV